MQGSVAECARRWLTLASLSLAVTVARATPWTEVATVAPVPWGHPACAVRRILTSARAGHVRTGASARSLPWGPSAARAKLVTLGQHAAWVRT